MIITIYFVREVLAEKTALYKYRKRDFYRICECGFFTRPEQAEAACAMMREAFPERKYFVDYSVVVNDLL